MDAVSIVGGRVDRDVLPADLLAGHGAVTVTSSVTAHFRIRAFVGPGCG